MEPAVVEPAHPPSPSPGRHGAVATKATTTQTQTQSQSQSQSQTPTTTTAAAAAAARPERNSVVPPYWRHHDHTAHRLSSYSTDHGHPTPISLEDHTEEDSEQCRVLWAKGVTVEEYVVVSGSAPGLGAYVVWNCTVETLDGGPMKIRKRYSEFEDLRAKLAQTFPHAVGSMPQFPPKSIISRFRPKFLEKRKQGLSFFLNCILLNPEFAGSPVLKEFLFS